MATKKEKLPTDCIIHGLNYITTTHIGKKGDHIPDCIECEVSKRLTAAGITVRWLEN